MVGLMLPPYFVARAIDEGLRERDLVALTWWAGAVIVVGVINAVLGMVRHRTMTFIRTDAAYRTVQVVTRRIVELGAALPRRVSVGELTNIQSADISRIARTLTVTGPGVGAIVAYTAIAVMLFTISGVLAVVVLLGVPFLVVVVGPLLTRLRDAESEYRDKQGELTARAGDIVAGLRVLCGIGGKATFAARYRQRSQALIADGYRVGAITSWVQAVGACLPVLFLGAIVWISARMAASGAISVGDMVAVYGYVAVLVVPVAFFIEGVDDITRGLVSAARVVAILALRSDIADTATDRGPDGPAPLRDPESGLVLPPGRMVALAAAQPAEAIAVVDRLGRYVDSAVRWGDVALSEVSLTEVRSRVLVADNDAHLFAGSLRDMIATRADHADVEIKFALHTANAEDIVDVLPDGLDTLMRAQGSDLSGGQRQRVRLVRALLANPEVLVLVEPTSAVDAHTEAVIARRVHAAREGRTTLVVGTSPLLLDQADEVAYLVDGVVAAVGPHGALLAAEPGYRALVFRSGDE